MSIYNILALSFEKQNGAGFLPSHTTLPIDITTNDNGIIIIVTMF
jgi:hypothetical protein